MKLRWASDVNVGGIRLEALSEAGDWLFEDSVPDVGPVSINTFGKEVPADLAEEAIRVARTSRLAVPPATQVD